MQQNFDHALALTLREEGGFVSDPRDKGGLTNLGVTQRVYESYIGHPVDEATMRALTLDDVRELYRTLYWNKIAGDILPSGLDCALFDFAVNSGPRRASLALQSLLNVKPDGVIGPITLQALGVEMKISKTPLFGAPPQSASPDAGAARGSGAPSIGMLIAKLATARLDYLRTLPAFTTFGKGWTARVNRVAEEAARMCS